MDSSEEEKLAQMVCDFIESRSPSPICLTSSAPPISDQTTCLTLQAIVSNTTKVEMVVLDKILKYFKKVRCERKTGSLKRWLVMKLRMAGYDASLCTSINPWVTSLSCSGGCYEYIDTMMHDENGRSVRLIVDIDFKSQFELARPTDTYMDLLNHLPIIFVGNEKKLLNIISLLCSAAKQSLKERGLHIPPWRKMSYMQSKWLSCCQRLPTTTKEVCSDAKGSSKFTMVKPEGRNLGVDLVHF